MSVNTAVMGSPGSAKSTLLELLMIPYLLAIKRGEKVRLVVTDEHGPFARAVGMWCVRLGLEAKMAYDRLDDKRVIGYRFRTLGAEALLAKCELESFIDSLMFQVGYDGSIGHTYYRESGRLLWNLAKFQVNPYPLSDMRWLLRPGALRDRAIAGCTDPDTRYMAQSFVNLTRSEQEKVYRTVVRALDDLADGFVFSRRADGTYGFEEDITIMQGSQLVASEESRMAIGMGVNKAHDSGMTGNGQLVIASDESVSLWCPAYARRLEVGRKYGIRVLNGFQSPKGDPELVRRMFNAFDEQWYGYMADHEVAERAAKNLLGGTDPNLKERQTRIQQLHAGHEEKQVGDRMTLVSIYREVEVHHDRSVGLMEQVLDEQRCLMKASVGQFRRKCGGRITAVQIKPMKAYPLDPDLGERLLDEAIARIQRRPYYVDVEKPKPVVAGATERWNQRKRGKK